MRCVTCAHPCLDRSARRVSRRSSAPVSKSCAVCRRFRSPHRGILLTYHLNRGACSTKQPRLRCEQVTLSQGTQSFAQQTNALVPQDKFICPGGKRLRPMDKRLCPAGKYLCPADQRLCPMGHVHLLSGQARLPCGPTPLFRRRRGLSGGQTPMSRRTKASARCACERGLRDNRIGLAVRSRSYCKRCLYLREQGL